MSDRDEDTPKDGGIASTYREMSEPRENGSPRNGNDRESRSRSRSRSRSPDVKKDRTRSPSEHSRHSRAESEKRPSVSGSRRSRKEHDDEDRYKSRSRSRSRSVRKHKRYSRSRSKSYSDRSRSRSRSASRRRYGGGRGGGGGGREDHREKPKPSRCVGIFGLSTFTTESQIYQIFSKYGPVEKVHLIVDAKMGKSRGFAFVYYDSVEDATAAKDACSGTEIDGRIIRVDYSITKKPHNPTPGVYMGRPTYVHDYRRDRRRDHRDDHYEDRYSRNDRYRDRRSPSPRYRSSRRYERSRSRSYSPYNKYPKGAAMSSSSAAYPPRY